MAHFNIIEFIPGTHSHNAHIVTAAVATGFTVLMALAARLALGKGEAAIVPAGKVSIKGIFEGFTDLLVWMSDLVIGKHGRIYVPIFGSIFVFVLFNNLLGLLPGAIPATENINTGFAIGIFSFVYYNYIGIKNEGTHYFAHFMGPVWWLAPLILPIELISHAVRPLTLGLRLSGNMTGDHTVLGIFLDLFPIGVPMVFYALGLFVCFLQAFIFTILSMVYVMMASSHE